MTRSFTRLDFARRPETRIKAFLRQEKRKALNEYRHATLLGYQLDNGTVYSEPEDRAFSVAQRIISGRD